MLFFNLPLFVALNLAVVVLGSNRTENDLKPRSVMGDNIRNMLEQLRARMHMNMTDTMGIPRLDPFTADSLVLDSSPLSDLGMGDFIMTLTNIRAVGLNQFVVDDADLQLAGLHFITALSVPSNITITGHHESAGVIGGFFAMNGSGPFSVTITGLHISIEGTINFASNVWTVPQLKIGFGIQQLAVDFQGIEQLGDLFNEMLSAIGPEMIREMWPTLEPSVSQLAKEMVEQSLAGISLLDVLAILSGSRDIFPPITDS